ncbi:MAG TPA: hypothetical protein VJV79_06520 [Polyangiaceae bacterium]|nr:hypothetical protein [Polyangiaceae bacterium]
MPSAAEVMVSLLDEDDRATLQRLAVARTITADVASVVLRANQDDLENLPLLRKAGWDDSGKIFLLDDGIRKALLAQADKTELTGLHVALAAYYDRTGDELAALYHRLNDPDSKLLALEQLEQRFDERLLKFQVGQAHDLLRLMEEAGNAGEYLVKLQPRLARRAGSLRERDLTTRYLERDFEAEAWQRLRDDPGRWILQLHAPGGMGKTMFLSNLVGRVCPKEEVPTAKVDFDFVAQLVQSTSEPWRLLLLLARQLNDQLEGKPFSSLLSEWGRYESVVYSSRRRDDLPPIGMDSEQHRAGNDVPLYFSRILAEVCQSRHVLIVFDTLENLLHADGATVMHLLEALTEVHASVPGLRLVLAGRFDFAGHWSSGQDQLLERLPGFGAAYIGQSSSSTLSGAEVVWGEQCLTIEVPPFSETDAKRYLALRGVVQDDYVAAIVKLADGNPLKLSLLADEVLADEAPTVAELLRIRSIELHHLVKRVIDRIADPQVQWLVRWGSIPRVLEKEFARKVLWELLGEQLAGAHPWDDVELDELSRLGRGSARYAVGARAHDFETTWSRLASYASRRSWISGLPDLPDAFVFHPETRDPIRGVLRACNQAIYSEVHRRGLEYFRALANELTGQARYEALRAAVFHLFEPWPDRPDPTREFCRFLESAGDDRELRASLATEVLDVELRASRPDREDLAPPPAAALGRAHAELALRAAFAPGFEQTRAEQFERHLALSDLPEGMRRALRARVALARGLAADALPLLAAALERESELDADTSWWTMLTRARIERDLPRLRALCAAASNTARQSEAVAALSSELFRREKFVEAANLYQELGDFVGVARALNGQGMFDAALQLLERRADERARIARAEVYLARLEPQAVLEDTGLHAIASIDDFPPGSSLSARASAMIDQSDAGLGMLESNVVRDDDLGDVDAVTAARIYLDRDQPERAIKVLDSLPANAPAERLASMLLLRAEASIQMGNPVQASLQLSRLDDAELPVSLAIELQLVSARVSGFSAILPRLVELLAELPTSNWRLAQLESLARIESPPVLTATEASAALDVLTTLEHQIPARLLLARVEVLRLLGRREEAMSLLYPVVSQGGTAEHLAHQAAARLARLPEPRGEHRPTGHPAVLSGPALSGTAATLPAPWGLVPQPGEVFPEQALVAVLNDWQGCSEALGAHILSLGLQGPRETVIDVATPQQAWIPWQIATVHGKPLAGIRRAHGETSERGRLENLAGTVSLLIEPAEHAQATAREVRKAWQPLVPELVTRESLAWQNWGSFIAQAGGIVHLVASFQQRRGGTVFLNLTKDRNESTGSAHIARALAGAGRPVLLILGSPWPGSITEAARQLFLREQFAFDVFREFPGANVLCVGLIEHPSRLGSYCSQLALGVKTRPLGRLVESLLPAQDPDSFASRLGCAATLYSQTPELRYDP